MQDLSDTSTVSAEDELAALKSRADLMGIPYHHKVGVEKLREKVNAAIEGKSLDVAEETEEGPAATVKVAPKAVQKTRTKAGKPAARLMTPREHQNYVFENRQRDAKSLVRIRCTCMNPSKKNWEGELISVGSAKLGTHKRFVQFGAIWHVPAIILQELKERKFTVFYTVTGARGAKIRKGRLVPEFAIEELPQLTAQERNELARKQAMAAGAEE